MRKLRCSGLLWHGDGLPGSVDNVRGQPMVQVVPPACKALRSPSKGGHPGCAPSTATPGAPTVTPTVPVPIT